MFNTPSPVEPTENCDADLCAMEKLNITGRGKYNGKLVPSVAKTIDMIRTIIPLIFDNILFFI